MSVNVAVRVISALVPVTITVYVPGGVLPVVVIVIVDGQVGVQEGGENVAVAPDGSPTAESETVGVAPGVRRTMVTVFVILPRGKPKSMPG